jgi:hypothetical protein
VDYVLSKSTLYFLELKNAKITYNFVIIILFTSSIDLEKLF